MKNRAGLERYWQVARYPENIDVLAGYAPFEVLDADQDERVEGVVLAEFPPLQQTVSAAYWAVRQHRQKGAKYLVILTEGGVPPVEQRMPHTRVAGSAAPQPGVNDIDSSL